MAIKKSGLYNFNKQNKKKQAQNPVMVKNLHTFSSTSTTTTTTTTTTGTGTGRSGRFDRVQDSRVEDREFDPGAWYH